MRDPRRWTPLAALLVASLLLAGCATTGATLNSGVGDAALEHPPWYAGATVAVGVAPVVHLPVAYQRGASQTADFDPKAGAGTPIAAFVAELNAYLDSLGASTRLDGAPPAGTPPDVQFGCDVDPSGDCLMHNDGEVLGRKGTTSRLAVGRPSEDWIRDAASLMDRAGAPAVLVITLEVGQYPLRQRGLRGDKEVELGTGYTAHVPWITSLETPVSVLQLTGARVGRDGKAIRIGAEGILARRTSLGISAIGGQALITDDDVQRARTLRREDLPGQPLAWQVAMRNLVAELTGRR